MSSIVRLSQFLTLSALLVAFGCASTPPAPEQSAPVAESKDAVGDTISDASLAKNAPVYFDTDSALLRPDARNVLESFAKTLLEHPEWGVLTIDGHCDERGSEKYNLSLGKGRAAVVERYLLDRGVPRSRLATRSFGEGRPAVPGHLEGAWRYNRRTELQVEALESAGR